MLEKIKQLRIKINLALTLIQTHFLYFSSVDFSNIGMPDKNKIMTVVKIGDITATHSAPSITFKEIIKIPHQSTISPK